MTKRTAQRRDPLPGETIYGGKLVRGKVQGGRLEHGPRAFFQGMHKHYGLLCDPDQPIEHGCRVLLRTPDGSRFDCTVLTKHPARAKKIDVRVLSNGVVLRKAPKEWLTRVMSFSCRGPCTSAVGRAAP